MKKKEDRQQLIKRLLTTYHLNVVDRQIFKDNLIDINEVKDIIRQSLTDNKIFPPTCYIWTKGQPVCEGYFIESVDVGKYELHWRRQETMAPAILAEKSEMDYNDFDMLVEHYMELEYNYNIDGLEIKNGKEELWRKIFG